MTAALIRPPGAIPMLTRSWVRFYCTGMSDQVKAVRLLEIESDLWEHFADRQAEGVSPAETNIEMFGRLLRGVPSDIAWRFQAEGFQMNINIPLERLAGVLILFLIIPFMMGATLGGYDFSREGWASEFNRFGHISPGRRDATGALHAFSGLSLVAVAALFFTMLRDRSPKLVTVGAALLMAGGIVMLINAAVYRAMSTLAEDYAASGDPSIVATARGFGVAIETLSGANLAATVFGILALSTALTRLQMVPRWTAALPIIAVTGLVAIFVFTGVADTLVWMFFIIGFLCVALWLLICGMWMLFGGSKPQPVATPGPIPV